MRSECRFSDLRRPSDSTHNNIGCNEESDHFGNCDHSIAIQARSQVDSINPIVNDRIDYPAANFPDLFGQARSKLTPEQTVLLIDTAFANQ